MLLDDDFTSIVEAVRLGRRIFDNLKKAMGYVFAIHVPIAGLSLFAVLFRWPLILEPVDVAFLELIIDPACSTIFEAEPAEEDIMQRPPRPANERIFNRPMVKRSLLQGLGVLAILLGIFALALHRGQSQQDARALTFTTLVLANVALIISSRSSRNLLHILRTPNPTMWWIVSGAVTFLGLILYVPYLKDLFHLSTLHADDLAACVAASVICIAWFEALKALLRPTRSAD